MILMHSKIHTYKYIYIYLWILIKFSCKQNIELLGPNKHKRATKKAKQWNQIRESSVLQ